jgi:hypothetical protein
MCIPRAYPDVLYTITVEGLKHFMSVGMYVKTEKSVNFYKLSLL